MNIIFKAMFLVCCPYLVLKSAAALGSLHCIVKSRTSMEGASNCKPSENPLQPKQGIRWYVEGLDDRKTSDDDTHLSIYHYVEFPLGAPTSHQQPPLKK